MINVESIRQDFPYFASAEPVIYLDNAATTFMPSVVCEALIEYYTMYKSNIHKAHYGLARKATTAYETARADIAQFINAKNMNEIVFTSGSTASFNMIAYGLAHTFKNGDEILISGMEHNSALLPWRKFMNPVDVRITYIETSVTGEITLEHIKAYTTDNTKLLVLTGMSNVSGFCPDLASIIAYAHTRDMLVCIDAAQLVAQRPVDVQALDCDFLIFSGHKLYGPTGIGVLYGKHDALEMLDLFHIGGGTVTNVLLDSIELATIPERFEAGTPHIAGAIGLQAAVHYMQSLGMKHIAEHECMLRHYAYELLTALPYISIVGNNTSDYQGIISFFMDGVHAHDVEFALDAQNIAVRTGKQCAHLYHYYLQCIVTIRMSFGIYTSTADIDAAVAALYDAYALLYRG